MKKLNKITAAFASLALVAAAFTGCVNSHANLDAMIDLSTFHVRGSCGSWDPTDDNKLTFNDEGYYEYSFVAQSDKVNFAVDDGTWSVTYRKDASNALVTYSLTDAVTAYPGNDASCPALSGLTVGTKYTVKVTPSSTTVSIAIEEGEATVPAFYVVGNGSLEAMTYNGAEYSYVFTATAATKDITVFSNGKYFKADDAIDAVAKVEDDTKYSDIETSDEAAVLSLKSLEIGAEYNVLLKSTTSKKTTSYSLLAVKKLPKLYIAGEGPLNWSLTDAANAIQMKMIGETTKYYYTFTAASTSLNFKVATKNDWYYAYSNCATAAGDTLTVLDSAPVAYDKADAQNACVSGLTVGKKYTILVDLANMTAPKVSVITGDEIVFGIGRGDFGGWDWNKCVTFVPVAAGEWKYEFTATEATAEFKFQTVCGGWNDAATWNAKAALTLGADYVDMSNGAGDPNTSATLTVGTEYVVSVKKVTVGETSKYQVKIAAK